jgi:hypothetical protein
MGSVFFCVYNCVYNSSYIILNALLDRVLGYSSVDSLSAILAIQLAIGFFELILVNKTKYI